MAENKSYVPIPSKETMKKAGAYTFLLGAAGALFGLAAGPPVALIGAGVWGAGAVRKG